MRFNLPELLFTHLHLKIIFWAKTNRHLVEKCIFILNGISVILFELQVDELLPNDVKIRKCNWNSFFQHLLMENNYGNLKSSWEKKIPFAMTLKQYQINKKNYIYMTLHNNFFNLSKPLETT